MKTDIQEYDDGYQLEIDLPGFKKDEVHAELKDGYLVVSAEKGLDEDEQDKKTGKYLRRERYAGSCQRSFYVGKDITEEDIKAQFQHGMLTLFVPKKEAKPVIQGASERVRPIFITKTSEVTESSGTIKEPLFLSPWLKNCNDK